MCPFFWRITFFFVILQRYFHMTLDHRSENRQTDMNSKDTKWVACWGNATSITDRREAVYAKDLTLRYPIRMPFSGTMLRFRFSNLTGTEPVTLTKVFVGHTPVTFGGNIGVTLMPGKETESDAISLAVSRGDTINVSMYLAGYTQMNSGTLITGPLSKGFYAYGDYANLTTSWQQFSYEFTLDSEKTVCLVIMNPKKSNYSSGKDILVDDATLTKK